MAMIVAMIECCVEKSILVALLSFNSCTSFELRLSTREEQKAGTVRICILILLSYVLDSAPRDKSSGYSSISRWRILSKRLRLRLLTSARR